MKLKFGYGKSTQVVEVPDKNLIAELHANPMEHNTEDSVQRALNNPIKSEKLRDIVKPGQTVAIVTSDISRPLPSYKIVPYVLEELYAGGIKKEDITIVLALGSHRKHTEEEKLKLIGTDEVKIVDSDINNTVHCGTTKNGTPADFDKNVVDADIRIALGNIEFHYFAGYSGGNKALMPGVSTPKAIQENHSLMTHPKSVAGNLDDNPVRLDIEEAAGMLGLDFIVNVVLDEHKNIVYTVAGDAIDAHREGCKYLDKMYRCKIPERADIVIVSQGGAPKDANLYQTQKALDNAKHAVKPGGSIILIGACNEGFGSKKFEEWLTESKTSHEMIDCIEKDFQLGGHKAAAIAMILDYADIYLISEMPDNIVKDIFLRPEKSAQDAFNKVFNESSTVISMPYGGSTLPVI